MMKKLFLSLLLSASAMAQTTTALNGGRSFPVVNSSTGTTLNSLVVFTSTGARNAITTDTQGVIGICQQNCGATGSSLVAGIGLTAACFDATPTQGDYFGISNTTGGCAHDFGTASAVTNQCIGTVVSASPVSSNVYEVLLQPGCGKSGGSTSLTLTTTGTSGAATLTGSVLNIPIYSSGGGGSGITALTGDVTASGSGSVAATVKGINGVLLSSLAGGPLCNTVTTGVPTACTLSAFTTLGLAPINNPNFTTSGGGNVKINGTILQPNPLNTINVDSFNAFNTGNPCTIAPLQYTTGPTQTTTPGGVTYTPIEISPGGTFYTPLACAFYQARANWTQMQINGTDAGENLYLGASTYALDYPLIEPVNAYQDGQLINIIGQGHNNTIIGASPQSGVTFTQYKRVNWYTSADITGAFNVSTLNTVTLSPVGGTCSINHAWLQATSSGLIPQGMKIVGDTMTNCSFANGITGINITAINGTTLGTPVPVVSYVDATPGPKQSTTYTANGAFYKRWDWTTDTSSNTWISTADWNNGNTPSTSPAFWVPATNISGYHFSVAAPIGDDVAMVQTQETVYFQAPGVQFTGFWLVPFPNAPTVGQCFFDAAMGIYGTTNYLINDVYSLSPCDGSDHGFELGSLFNDPALGAIGQNFSGHIYNSWPTATKVRAGFGLATSISLTTGVPVVTVSNQGVGYTSANLIYTMKGLSSSGSFNNCTTMGNFQPVISSGHVTAINAVGFAGCTGVAVPVAVSKDPVYYGWRFTNNPDNDAFVGNLSDEGMIAMAMWGNYTGNGNYDLPHNCCQAMWAYQIFGQGGGNHFTGEYPDSMQLGGIDYESGGGDTFEGLMDYPLVGSNINQYYREFYLGNANITFSYPIVLTGHRVSHFDNSTGYCGIAVANGCLDNTSTPVTVPIGLHVRDYWPGYTGSVIMDYLPVCASTASPEVCTNYTQGIAKIPTTGTSIVVNTGAVTAFQGIQLTYNNAASGCTTLPTNFSSLGSPYTSTIVNGASSSFTINVGTAPTGSSACINWKLY